MNSLSIAFFSRLTACVGVMALCFACNTPVLNHERDSGREIERLDSTDSSDTVLDSIAAIAPVEREMETTPIPLPDGFVDLSQRIPDLDVDLRYYSSDNFVGDTVNGYHAHRAILGRVAADSLAAVQAELREQGLGLKLYDGYRPQRAVDHFRAWARDKSDTLTKSIYYPDLRKGQLFALGYVARKSSHTRGSAVDVTLVYLHADSAGAEVDMGSPWDLFDEISWGKSSEVTPQQSANRELLRLSMVRHGYRSLPQEWWHFRLNNEPFPDTYFDFEIR